MGGSSVASVSPGDRPTPGRILQRGLVWEEGLFGPHPGWSRQPSVAAIESLCRQHLQIDADAKCAVSLYSEGYTSNTYKFKAGGTRSWLMRVFLPVDPRQKVASEVVTMNFVRAGNAIPVPLIVAHDNRQNNVLGFEWILQEHVHGHTLESKWRALLWPTKQNITRQLARYMAQLFAIRCETTGSLYSHPLTEEIRVGPMVTLDFVRWDRLHRNTPRGPFLNSRELFGARLRTLLEEQDIDIGTAEDDDDVEDAENARPITQQLLQMLPEVFTEQGPEETALFHDSLTLNNVLIDDAGNIVEIMDWNGVAALPLWRACKFPEMLDAKTRTEKPQKITYGEPVKENDLWWEHNYEYEAEQLRALYMTEMERLQPGWKDLYWSTRLRLDFEIAVSNCQDRFWLRPTQKWIAAYKEGRPKRLAVHGDPTIPAVLDGMTGMLA